MLPYGKVLIRQGDEVRKLYFIADGNVEVLFLDRARRNTKHLIIEEKPKRFSIQKNKPNKGYSK